jgi:hypothetical protein
MREATGGERGVGKLPEEPVGGLVGRALAHGQKRK